jgi:hypothetical protein
MNHSDARLFIKQGSFAPLYSYKGKSPSSIRSALPIDIVELTVFNRAWVCGHAPQQLWKTKASFIEPA